MRGAVEEVKQTVAELQRVKGWRDPVDTSHSKEEAPRGTETRLRNGSEIISEVEEQDCWRIEKWLK